MAEADYRITRTNSKRYVGWCAHCEWSTNVIQFRIGCAAQVRDHLRRVHPDVTVDPTKREGRDMKQPGTDLPDLGEKLSEYADHLVVFAGAHPGERDTSFGKRNTVEALVYVFLDGAWKNIGETPVFFRTVQKQINEAGDEPIGGVLIQGTDRNDREWYLAPVPKSDKKLTKALADWDADKAEPF